MSRGCHLTVQCQKHAKISCGKVQLTYMYKKTFPFFIDTPLEFNKYNTIVSNPIHIIFTKWTSIVS